MELEDRGRNTQDCKIALLIDAENVPHGKIAEMLAELSKYGTANIRHAYGDWTSANLKNWKEKLHDFAIRPVQQFSYSTGKNATDIALVIDAMELLYTQNLDAFCIVSSDADFTPLVMQLRANGHEVYGFGERKTPSPFVNACTAFLYLDTLDEPLVPAAPLTPAIMPKTAVKPEGNGTASSDTKSAGRALSQDTKLVTILRGAVEAAAREDGWSYMSAAGAAVKRQAPIDPRNYGVRNFTALFEATGLFHIHRTENGQCFVADKRNKDRSSQPSD
ncbi:NYN domain-containing protein [uncultured Croceicoccus sp.]|uniref:NYN domain-containing protein n=1 Tax=uncultured Croceicoccus sp. TaxID=1295329 RepID=UPI002605A881|nr:NYN domain-containing protein [uncultured Croceicoccus sp.]